MRSVILSVIIMCMSMISACTNEQEVYEQKRMQATLLLIDRIMVTYEKTEFQPLFDPPPDMKNVCRISQPEIEDVIKQYVIETEGGMTKAHIARALAYVKKGIPVYADAVGNRDGKAMESEIISLMENMEKSDGAIFLLCMMEMYLTQIII